MSYAEGTTVSAISSQMEIGKIVQKYAGPRAEFAIGQSGDTAEVVFAAHGRRVRFTLPLPTIAEAAKGAATRTHRWPSDSQKKTWVEKETRRRWRCLVLAIKAKLEVVESGIASFEEEFLAHIMNCDGITVYQALKTCGETGAGGRLLPPIQDA